MRIDAHHHFWKLGRYDYPWLGPKLSAIYRDFGPGDLPPLLARHRMDCTVLVQTVSSLGDWKHLTGTFTFGGGETKAELDEIIRQSLALWPTVG